MVFLYTQLIIHERLNLGGFIILSHITLGSCKYSIKRQDGKHSYTINVY